MKIIFQVAFTFLCLALLNGCISVPMPQMYIPQKKHEFQATAMLGNNGLSFNAAYAPDTNYVFNLAGNGKIGQFTPKNLSLEGGAGWISENKRLMLSLNVGGGSYRLYPMYSGDHRPVQSISGSFGKVALGLNALVWKHAGFVARISNSWGKASVDIEYAPFEPDYMDTFWAPFGLEGLFYIQATRRRNLLFSVGFGGSPILNSPSKTLLTGDGFLYPTPFFVALGYRFVH